MNAEDFPEKTLDELTDEEKESLPLVGDKEFESMYKELTELAEVVLAGTMLARMLQDNKITLREYEMLLNKLEDYDEQLDVSVR